MPRVEPIEDLEDFFRKMSAAAFAADLAVQPFQVAIQPGDYYLRYVPEVDLVVCGEILNPMGYWDDLKKPWDDDTQAEYDYEKSHWESHQMRHMRWTKSYSVACEDGELGSVHVVTMSPITQSQFETLREAKWPPSISGCLAVLRC